MSGYQPFESKGLNLYNLIRELGGDPEAQIQAPFDDNVVKALWNLKSTIEGLTDEVPVITAVSTNYTISDYETIVVDNLTSDIEITLPAAGRVWIKRLDESGYAVTIKGTVDGISDIFLEFTDGLHLRGVGGEFVRV
jgi:hypothetical protein